MSISNNPNPLGGGAITAAGGTPGSFSSLTVTGASIFGGQVTATSLAGTGSRAVIADANGVLSAPVSDENFKEELRPIPESYGLEAVLQMKPSIFKFKDKEAHGDRDYLGFGARAMEKIIPEIIGQTKDGTYYLTDEKLTAVLVKGMQQLAARVAQLESANQ